MSKNFTPIKNQMVSIVAPMFNEEDNLESTLTQVKQELASHQLTNYEIIFVNDGSSDNTWKKAQELADNEPKLQVVGYPVNQGRGKAIRTGIDTASGDIIVTIDFDLTYDVAHIGRMLKALEENPTIDVVLSSCYMPGGNTIGVAPFRLFVSKMANLLYSYAYSPKIYTSTCVVRAYRSYAVKDLELISDEKEIHLEILSKVLANGFKIKEIPGTLTRRDGEVKGNRKTFKFRSQSIAHIIYFIQEKPFAIFGLFGLVLAILGFLSTSILFYTRFADNSIFNNTFVSKLVSPSFIIMLFMSGLQMMGIGFLGIQNNMLKKELFKIQRMINENKN